MDKQTNQDQLLGYALPCLPLQLGAPFGRISCVARMSECDGEENTRLKKAPNESQQITENFVYLLLLQFGAPFARIS